MNVSVTLNTVTSRNRYSGNTNTQDPKVSELGCSCAIAGSFPGTTKAGVMNFLDFHHFTWVLSISFKPINLLCQSAT